MITKWGAQFSSGWFSRSCSGSPVLLPKYPEEVSLYCIHSRSNTAQCMWLWATRQSQLSFYSWLNSLVCSYLRYIYLSCKYILGVVWGRLKTSRNMQKLSRSAEQFPSVWKHGMCNAQGLWLQWKEGYQVATNTTRLLLGYTLEHHIVILGNYKQEMGRTV